MELTIHHIQDFRITGHRTTCNLQVSTLLNRPVEEVNFTEDINRVNCPNCLSR